MTIEINFQQKVLETVKLIPKGKVTTYKEIAEHIGTKAYRAVGTALKNNKNPIIIPCHRVINSNGSVGGYNKGQLNKIRLLRSEGIEIKNNKISLKNHFFEY